MKNILLFCVGAPQYNQLVYELNENKSYADGNFSISGVTNSSINPPLKSYLVMHGIPFYEWESLFGRDLTNLTSYIISDLDINHYLNADSILIAHRLYLRTIYATMSHYNFNLMLNYFVCQSIRFLDLTKPDILISPDVPHSFGDYIMAAIAFQRDVPSLAFRRMGLNGRVLSRFVDIKTGNDLKLSSLSQFDPKTKDSELKRIYRTCLDFNQHIYTKNHLTSQLNGRAEAKKEILGDPCSYTDVIESIRSNKISIMSKENSLITTKSLIVFLHFEPEASICPSAGRYSDQLRFLVSANYICSKLGYSLLVREHPEHFKLPKMNPRYNKHNYTSSLNARTKDFYANIESLSCFNGYCQTLSVENIMAHEYVDGIFSVTGSCLLQASVHGKTGIYAIQNYAQDLPSLIHIDKLIKTINAGLDVSINAQEKCQSQDEFSKKLGTYLFCSEKLLNFDKNCQYSQNLLRTFCNEISSLIN